MFVYWHPNKPDGPKMADTLKIPPSPVKVVAAVTLIVAVSES